MSIITNPIRMAADLIVGGALDEFIGKVYGVATALADGTMAYDKDGNNGKGRFKGGKALFDNIMAESADVPENYEGQISKIAKGIVELGAYCVVADHDDRLAEVRRFCQQYKTLNNLSSILYPTTESKGRTLAAIVASMFTEATAEKNGYSVEDIVAEVLAQAEGQPED